MSALEHGGRLHAAAQRYGRPVAQWLDLSTGINPCGYPVPAVPPGVWNRLPEDDDALPAAARAYYGVSHLLAVPGTQAAIQRLPGLRAPCRVGVLTPLYGEHAHAWRAAGHAVRELAELTPATARGLDVLVLANPNNPTGQVFMPEVVADLRAALAPGGWLVADEAFVDPTPAQSLLAGWADARAPGLVVLRSVGKFFGLAGARVGFVAGDAAVLAALGAALGPWSLAGPSRHVAAQALADRAWQARTRARLARDGARLAALLTRHGLRPAGGCALFAYVRARRADAMHRALARQGVLTRLFDQPPALRFGLPGTEADWQRLDRALAACQAAADARA